MGSIDGIRGTVPKTQFHTMLPKIPEMLDLSFPAQMQSTFAREQMWNFNTEATPFKMLKISPN